MSVSKDFHTTKTGEGIKLVYCECTCPTNPTVQSLLEDYMQMYVSRIAETKKILAVQEEELNLFLQTEVSSLVRQAKERFNETCNIAKATKEGQKPPKPEIYENNRKLGLDPYDFEEKLSGTGRTHRRYKCPNCGKYLVFVLGDLAMCSNKSDGGCGWSSLDKRKDYKYD